MGRSLFVALLLMASTLVTALPATRDVVGRPLGAAPQSRVEGDQAIDAATAAALIGAISSEFGEREVQVKLDKVTVTPTSIVQRDITGEGRVLIGRDPEWIPFRFAALYDTVQASADKPTLTLGGTTPGTALALDSPLSRQLAGQVNRRLHAEFAQQPSRFSADSVQLVSVGSHYQRLEATGIARFGSDGSTRAGVQALYDRRTGEWVRVSYELGTTANRPTFNKALVSR